MFRGAIMDNENDKQEDRKLARVNMIMPEELRDWYKEEAYHLGMGMSTLMMITLKQARDQQLVLNNMSSVMDRVNVMEKAEIEKALQETFEE